MSNPWQWSPGRVVHSGSGRQLPVELADLGDGKVQIWLAGQLFEVERARSGPRRAGAGAAQSQESVLKASMPGSVLAVLVGVGDSVEANQVLIKMESMKMELSLTAPRAGKVARIEAVAGQMVERGALLLELEK